MSSILPMNPLLTSQDAKLAAMVGQAWYETPGPNAAGGGTIRYMLVKATVAIAAPQGKAVLWAATPAFNIGALAGAAATTVTVAGMIPAEFVGSINVGDYVLIARNALSLSAFVAIAVAANTLLTTDANGRLTSAGAAAGNTLAQTNLAAAGSTTVSVGVILNAL